MKDKKKIILYIPTLLGGGAERVFVNLANHFASRGKEVYLFTSYNGIYDELIKDNVNVRYILKERFFKNSILNAIHRILFSLIKISFFLVVKKPTHLFCTLTEANIIGSICKKMTFNPTILIVRQAGIFDGINNDNSFKIKVNNKLLKKSFLYADVIIANSYDTSEVLIKDLKIPKENITIIGNPIYSELIIEKSNLNLNHSWVRNDIPYILSVGRLIPTKDFVTLLEAFRIVRNEIDVKLIILGEGPEKNNLKILAQKLDLSDFIDFVGFVQNPYPFYGKAKLFCLSSISEGFGNVLVESLAVGTPVVSTTCSGGPSFILNNGKFGSLVPVNDPVEMAKAIIAVLNHEKIYNKEDLIKRAKDFSITNIGDKYLEVICHDSN